MHTSVPMQASGRGTELQRGVVSGGHFPQQILCGKAERVVSLTLRKPGTKEVGGSGRHAGQGVRQVR